MSEGYIRLNNLTQNQLNAKSIYSVYNLIQSELKDIMPSLKGNVQWEREWKVTVEDRIEVNTLFCEMESLTYGYQTGHFK